MSTHLMVKDEAGRSFVVPVNTEFDLVSHVKDRMLRNFVSADLQLARRDLYFDGNRLEDDTSLASLRLGGDSVVYIGAIRDEPARAQGQVQPQQQDELVPPVTRRRTMPPGAVMAVGCNSPGIQGGYPPQPQQPQQLQQRPPQLVPASPVQQYHRPSQQQPPGKQPAQQPQQQLTATAPVSWQAWRPSVVVDTRLAHAAGKAPPHGPYTPPPRLSPSRQAIEATTRVGCSPASKANHGPALAFGNVGPVGPRAPLVVPRLQQPSGRSQGQSQQQQPAPVLRITSNPFDEVEAALGSPGSPVRAREGSGGGGSGTGTTDRHSDTPVPVSGAPLPPSSQPHLRALHNREVHLQHDVQLQQSTVCLAGAAAREEELEMRRRIARLEEELIAERSNKSKKLAELATERASWNERVSGAEARLEKAREESRAELARVAATVEALKARVHALSAGRDLDNHNAGVERMLLVDTLCGILRDNGLARDISVGLARILSDHPSKPDQ